jgi:phosphatidate cytidylyltransferase
MSTESASPVETPPRGEPVHPRPPTPLESRPAKRASNLTLRLVTAAILVPPVLWAIARGGVFTLATVIVVVLLGLREFYALIEAKGAHPLHALGYVAGAALPVVAFFGNEYHANLLLTSVLLAAMVLQLGKAEIGEALASISGTFFGVFYVGWLLSHAVVLRQFHDVVASRFGEAAVAGMHPQVGIFLLIFCITTVVWEDTGAYFVGRAYGKRKLAPKVSPGKTIEGALGGVAAGTLAGLATKGIFDLFWPDLSIILPWATAALLGMVLSVVGILGDLVESLIKRDAQLKDTGTLLPGTGGILDRIDSSLLGIPVMYYLMLAIIFVRVG